MGVNVVSGTASNMLGEKENLPDIADFSEVEQVFCGTSLRVSPVAETRNGILQIPPFPGARVQHFSRIAAAPVDAKRLASAMLRYRVGGSYWGAQPHLPKGHVLVRSAFALGKLGELGQRLPVVVWDRQGQQNPAAGSVHIVTGDCDPWHVLRGAAALVAEADDELRLIAALLDIPFHLVEMGEVRAAPIRESAVELVAQAFSIASFENPFTGEPMDALEAVELCGFWRQLIDSNRDVGGAIGFAFWKQGHVAPLLWNGSAAPRFIRNAANAVPGEGLAVWRAKVSAPDLAILEHSNSAIIEVEDGFLRSRGLGADCIPPLSITFDRRGAHFDPSQSSDLEILLEQGHFDRELLDRARELQRLIVEAGIGKYERGTVIIDRPRGDRRHILVPGQVEDDRAVQIGGCGLVSNLELLRRVRAEAPDAYILYKPHPDVLAGHRRGAIADHACLEYADEIVGELPIASLIAMVDEVHVNTSLAGFEALLRGKKVTTYGVPFYAGWGLTNDLGPVPKRRTRKRSIDELVAASLLLYPRYLDPVTGLPCPAEIVALRLSAGETSDGGLIVGMRRFQGKLLRRLRSLVQ